MRRLEDALLQRSPFTGGAGNDFGAWLPSGMFGFRTWSSNTRLNIEMASHAALLEVSYVGRGRHVGFYDRFIEVRVCSREEAVGTWSSGHSRSIVGGDVGNVVLQ